MITICTAKPSWAQESWLPLLDYCLMTTWQVNFWTLAIIAKWANICRLLDAKKNWKILKLSSTPRAADCHLWASDRYLYTYCTLLLSKKWRQSLQYTENKGEFFFMLRKKGKHGEGFYLDYTMITENVPTNIAMDYWIFRLLQCSKQFVIQVVSYLPSSLTVEQPFSTFSILNPCYKSLHLQLMIH